MLNIHFQQHKINTIDKWIHKGQNYFLLNFFTFNLLCKAVINILL